MSIPLAKPSLMGNEKAYVLDCLNRNQLSWVGPYVQKFEEEFAGFCGTQFGVSCSSGTAALHLALVALNIGPGDDVYIPDLTYVATANTVKYTGAEPIFCNIDEKTWCIDPVDVRSKIFRSLSNGRRPAAIIAVHLYGVPADMKSLQELSDNFDLHLIEDAAEAPGAEIAGERIGSLSDVACFSFYGNKIITCGEGGMLTTDDEALDMRLRFYRGQGVSINQRYYHEAIGFNYRLTNIQAAVGYAQLEQYEEQAVKRKVIVNLYRKLFEGWEMQEIAKDVIPADWLFSLLIPKFIDRDDVMKQLALAEIETRPLFIPMTQLPMYKGPTALTVRDISSRGISLPTFPSMTEREIQCVAENVKKVVNVQSKSA